MIETAKCEMSESFWWADAALHAVQVIRQPSDIGQAVRRLHPGAAFKRATWSGSYS
jgi:hypothetical protein